MSTSDAKPYSLAELCITACAEAWRGDGEILASPIGVIPTLGARLAALTFEPDLVYSDGDAVQLGAPLPLGAPPDAPRVAEAWLPFGKMFDFVWSGRRHVMMGATQVDRYGNQNIACIGPWERPKAHRERDGGRNPPRTAMCSARVSGTPRSAGGTPAGTVRVSRPSYPLECGPPSGRLGGPVSGSGGARRAPQVALLAVVVLADHGRGRGQQQGGGQDTAQQRPLIAAR